MFDALTQGLLLHSDKNAKTILNKIRKNKDKFYEVSEDRIVELFNTIKIKLSLKIKNLFNDTIKKYRTDHKSVNEITIFNTQKNHVIHIAIKE